MFASGQKFQRQRGACGQTVGMEQPSDDTPSASLRSAAPSEREPGMAGPIQPGTRENPTLRAIFIAPTKAQNVLHSTIQRTGQSITEKGEFVPGKYEFTFSYVMASSFCRTSRKYSGRGAKTRTGRPSRGWRKQRAPAWRHWVSWPSSFFLWP